MSDYDNNEDAWERALKRHLDQQHTDPSREHDNAILLAAKKVTEEERSATQPTTKLESVPKTHTAQKQPKLRWAWAVAATSLVIIGAMILRQLPSELPPDVVRNGNTLGNLVTPADNSELARLAQDATFSFSWPPGSAGSTYRLTLRDNDAQTLWQSDWLTIPEQTLTPTLRELLWAPGEYMWSVEIRGSGATVLGPFRFTIAGEV